jgi:hypothetical protein
MLQADVVARQTRVDDDPELIGYRQMTSRSTLCPQSRILSDLPC